MKGARDLTTGLPPQDSIAFLTFAGKIENRVDFTKERAVILQALEKISAGRRAFPKGPRKGALWGALLEGLHLLGAPRPGDVLYVITVGATIQNQEKRQEFKQALLSSGVRLFVFALVSPGDVGLGTGSALYDLQDMIEKSGGFLASTLGKLGPNEALATLPGSDSHYFLHLPQVPALLQASIKQTLAFYQIELELSETVDKPREWKLQLNETPLAMKNHWRVTYPSKILPCEEGTP